MLSCCGAMVDLGSREYTIVFRIREWFKGIHSNRSDMQTYRNNERRRRNAADWQHNWNYLFSSTQFHQTTTDRPMDGEHFKFRNHTSTINNIIKMIWAEIYETLINSVYAVSHKLTSNLHFSPENRKCRGRERATETRWCVGAKHIKIILQLIYLRSVDSSVCPCERELYVLATLTLALTKYSQFQFVYLTLDPVHRIIYLLFFPYFIHICFGYMYDFMSSIEN